MHFSPKSWNLSQTPWVFIESLGDLYEAEEIVLTSGTRGKKWGSEKTRKFSLSTESGHVIVRQPGSKPPPADWPVSLSRSDNTITISNPVSSQPRHRGCMCSRKRLDFNKEFPSGESTESRVRQPWVQGARLLCTSSVMDCLFYICRPQLK